MLIEVITPPESEPLTVEELKGFLRVYSDLTEDDALIESLAKSARELLENRLSIALLPTTFRETRTVPFNSSIRLLRGPVLEVTSVSVDGGEPLDPLPLPQNDRLTVGSAGQTVVIEYTAGWATVDDLPDTAKLIIKLITSSLYDNRGTAMNDLPSYIWALANSLSQGREIAQ